MGGGATAREKEDALSCWHFLIGSFKKTKTLRGATQAGTNFFQARLAFLCFFHYHFYSGDFSEDSQ